MCNICDSEKYKVYPREAVINYAVCNGCYKILGIEMLPTPLIYAGTIEPYMTECNIVSPEKLHIWKSYNREYNIDNSWICPHCKREHYWIIELCHDSTENFMPNTYNTEPQNRDNYVRKL